MAMASNSQAHSLTILNNDYDAFDALLHNIYEKTQTDNWFKPAGDSDATGVCIRVEAPSASSGNSSEAQSAHPDGLFRVFPYENPRLVPFEEGVRKLNVEVAVKIRSASVHAALARVPLGETSILIDQNTRIQILDSVECLPLAERDQCGAFIRSDHTLVLWSFALENIIPLCQEFEEKLIKYVWRTRGIPRRDRSSNTPLLWNEFTGAVPPHQPPFTFPHPTAILPSIPSTPFSASSSCIPTQTNSHTDLSPAPASVYSHTAGPFGMEGVDRSAAAHVAFGEDNEKGDGVVTEKQKEGARSKPKPTSNGWLSKVFSWWKLDSSKHDSDSDPDPESPAPRRKLVLLGPFYAGMGAGLAMYFMTAGVSNLIEEWALDGTTKRFGLVVVLPVIFCVSIFFCLQLIGNLSLILGPVSQYHENSVYYSAKRPKPNPEVDAPGKLPHITIQCPVYKESLELTIAPSVFSIKKAMQTYARQGGTSSIFICDDGLQLISEEDRKARIQFYANHNIGWVARPKHDSSDGGFKRPGKFKKASNMNYGLAVSVLMEQHLNRLLGSDSAAGDDFSRGGHAGHGGDGKSLEEYALELALEQVYEESTTWPSTSPPLPQGESGGVREGGKKHRPWAANAKSLRVGEIILIIDADTVVPEDCFRDAAREMGERGGEEVAIIQHESDVMQVAHHYFENGITHFTRRINKCISYGCANGEVAPFVGHNAFLRWSAVQDASFLDPADGKRKFWSEANVSEDFDLALRLLLKGYTLRWATYSQGGFKEGVSLTVVDELARWQKYAYGCDEIIFNPIIKWWKNGPISKQLRGFMWSDVPVHYKIGMSSYMFSYYGIAAATIGSTLNYLLLGLAPELDRFYLHSFEILLACVVIFPGLGNLGFTLLEYRLGHRTVIGSAVENLRWVPFFLFFFGGLSIHLSTAILAHMFSYDMTWGSTGKEVEKSTFWIEVPRIFKNFKVSFIICTLLMAMMIVFTTNAVPFEWQIPGWNWALVIPLSLVIGCHFLLPIVLNPWLMKFSY